MTAKEENLPLLQLIQDQGSSGTDQYFDYTFNIGEKNEFQIRVSGGQFGGSEPDEILANLAEYKKLKVQIFETLKYLEPRSLDNLEIGVMGYAPILPDTDYRFAHQPWVKDCQILMRGPNTAKIRVSHFIASPDTVCDIVRHCQKLIELKAFW